MPRKSVLITGGTGFLGRFLVQEFLEAGYRVGVLCQSTSNRASLAGHAVAFFEANIESASECATAFDQARQQLGPFELIHNAALISYRRKDHATLWRTNATGVENVLSAARNAGVIRAVHVSSVVAVGISPHGSSIDETAPYDAHKLGVAYVDSKHAGEQIALRDWGELQVMIANPGAIFGPVDARSNSGRFLVGMAQGRIGKFAPPGGMAAVGVWDCARGIRLALERGQAGRRYILTESYLSGRELFALVGELLAGRDPVWCTLPRWAWAVVRSGVSALARLREPSMVTPEALTMLGTRFEHRSDRAQKELGFQPEPFRAVLTQTIAILRAQGVLPPQS